MSKPATALTRPGQLADELHEHLHQLITEAQAGDAAAVRWLADSFPGHDLHVARLLSGDGLTPEQQIECYADYCAGLTRRLADAQAKSAAVADQLNRQRHAHLYTDLLNRDQARQQAEQQEAEERQRLQHAADAGVRSKLAEAERAGHDARRATELMFGQL